MGASEAGRVTPATARHTRAIRARLWPRPNMPAPLGGASWGVVAYRELLARTRAQRAAAATAADEPAVARAALDLARSRAAAYAAAKRAALGASAPDPRDALARVAGRARAARARLAAARDARVASLRAVAADLASSAGAAAAVATAARGRLRMAARAGAAEREAAMLGGDGLLRVSEGRGGWGFGGRAAAARRRRRHLTPSFPQHLVVRSLGSASHAFMHRAVTTRIEGGDALAAAALSRAPRVPLLTVSNHETALDDPLVVSALLPAHAFATPSSLRWTLCATDRCFKNALMSAFFRAGKVLPVDRGAGLAQPGMAAAEGRLAAGEWVHIFPEGTRSRDGALRPARKGVGRLAVAAARATGEDPVLLPFAHSGLNGALRGGTVGVAVGDPVPVRALMDAHAAAGSPGGDDALYMAVTAAVGRALAGCKARADALAGVAAARAPPLARFATDADSLIPARDELDPLLADEVARLAPRWACAAPALAGAALRARAPPRGAAASALKAGLDPVSSALRGDAPGGGALDALSEWARGRRAAAATALAPPRLALALA